ncbi:glutaredoxin [Candidatus Gracilibacteria bacterium]|nr:glutaredoxin [Candidatus Gracilibacteria bacterium]
MKIYIKPSCPYCIRLLKLLDNADLHYEIIDVIADSDMGDVMTAKSGQGGVPEVEIANVIIPDYATEETLVADIRRILKVGKVDKNLEEQLTSTIVYLD